MSEQVVGPWIERERNNLALLAEIKRRYEVLKEENEELRQALGRAKEEVSVELGVSADRAERDRQRVDELQRAYDALTGERFSDRDLVTESAEEWRALNSVYINAHAVPRGQIPGLDDALAAVEQARQR